MDKLHEKISLGGRGWYIHEGVGGNGYEDIQKEKGGWIEAQVPGNIQWDLENARMLEPLWYGTGDERLLDVCKKDWWYLKEFMIPREYEDRRLILRFWGVDYSCQIYLNGHFVGRNEGMFKRFEVDITDEAKAGEVNRLHVKIDRMPPELLDWIVNSDGKMSGEDTPYFFVWANTKIRQTLKGLKSPANCSYDWGTNIYTLGIWKDVELCVSGEARIEWLTVKSSLEEGYSRAKIYVSADVCASQSQDIQAVFRIEETGCQVTERAGLKKGGNKIEACIEMEDPKLWWPSGIGQPDLYHITVQLRKDDFILDEEEERFGIRDIRWECCEGVSEDFPNKFRLILNGTPVRTMGSNFVVPDLLYARAEKKYRYFVKMAKECNMNTLRQHGGQVVFAKDFYDAADEMGIMVLADFPIGNCVPENEPVFLENFKDTIQNIVRQLRNHPSIIEWSGGNELDWYFNPNADHTALRAEEQAVSAEDDTRLFRATCPISGSRHAPWDYQMDVTYKQFNRDIKDNFGKIPMMRYGEFGCQTPANLETWYRDVPPESQWPIEEEDPVLIRKNAVNAVFGPDFWLCKGRIEQLFGKADGLEMLIRAGQFIGAEGVRYMMDALRAKGKRVGGFTSWDYNEPWPNCAGSYMIDYDGRPVMMYHYVKQALEPLALQLKYDHILYDFYEDTYAELLLVSDKAEKSGMLRWKWTARDRFGKVFGTNSGTAETLPQEAASLDRIRINPPENMMFGPSIVELTLQDGDGSLISERMYVFGAKGAVAPLRGLLKSDMKNHEYGVAYVTTGMTGGQISRTRLRLADCIFSEARDEECMELTLENTGDMTAFFIEIHPLREYRTDLMIDNNYAFIPPKERRTVRVRAEKGGIMSLRQTGFTVRCWNSEELTIEPDESVLLYMGRKDDTCRGYLGYPEGGEEVSGDGYRVITAIGNKVLSAEVPYLSGDAAGLKVHFNLSEDLGHGEPGDARLGNEREQGGKRFGCDEQGELLLRIHTSDQDPSGTGWMCLDLNGYKVRAGLPAGLGVQKKHPEKLAFPKTVEVIVPVNCLSEDNELVINVQNGWFTWDAMELIRNKGEGERKIVFNEQSKG